MNFGFHHGPLLHGVGVAAPITKFSAVDWGGGGIKTGSVSTATIDQSMSQIGQTGMLDQSASLNFVPVMMLQNLQDQSVQTPQVMAAYII